jgi:HSP20 family molecular chaperone IbpA
VEHEGDEPEYLIARVSDALAEDPRVSEVELDVDVEDGTVVIRGTVPTEERRRGVGEVLAERFPELAARNEVTVLEPPDPPAEEVVR